MKRDGVQELKKRKWVEEEVEVEVKTEVLLL